MAPIIEVSNDVLRGLDLMGIKYISRDDNPAQVSLTPGWSYVPSIGMEFSPDLNELGSNWYDAHKLTRAKGFVMPSPDETWALIFEAKANLAKLEFRKLFEFFTKKTPKNTWHGEWQDAFFKEENGKMYVHRFKEFNAAGDAHLDIGADITGTYLANDGYVNISQRANITPQGLCKVADDGMYYAEGENMYSWHPRNEAVARFVANSGRADFDCIWDPNYSSASLGVRYARHVAPSVLERR